MSRTNGRFGESRAARFVYAFTASLMLGSGCAPAEPAQREAAGVEFVRSRSGGLCPSPDGGGAVCRLSVVVRDDGSWSANGAPPPTLRGGAIQPGSASELVAIIEEGWDALTDRAFTDICPTAYDGSEVSYAIRRIPQGPSAALADADVREVRSCTHDLSHPAAQAVLTRLDRLWRGLGLPE